MLPRFEIVHRLRPVDLIAPGPALDLVDPGRASETALPRPAPYVAVVATLAADRSEAGPITLSLRSGAVRLTGRLDERGLGLEVSDPTGTSTHRSRRHGRGIVAPSAVGVTLTGSHLTVWALEGAEWIARGWVDLRERIATHDEAWLAALHVGHEGAGATRLRAGAWGQLGLRDVRVVSHADGTPVTDDGDVWLTATSAGPGFFDTGHTSVWRLGLADPRRRRADTCAAEHRPDAGTQGPETTSVRASTNPVSLTHTADLYFRRPDRPGVFGDHATQLVRDGDGWLVATSTWGDFSADDPDRAVRVTLARTDADLLTGEHVLDTSPLALPDPPQGSVGQWDPHVVRAADGEWLVAWVSARRYFRFHPCVATGPALDALTLRATDERRVATEGVTWLRDDDAWRLLASDGPDSRRGQRQRMPVLDADLTEVGVLDAPYPTNLPWPTVVPVDDGWLLVSFDGTAAGGPLLGYGTHGDLVVMRST